MTDRERFAYGAVFAGIVFLSFLNALWRIGWI